MNKYIHNIIYKLFGIKIYHSRHFDRKETIYFSKFRKPPEWFAEEKKADQFNAYIDYINS